jgi:phenylalanyl-tRNA synthetase beta chain
MQVSLEWLSEFVDLPPLEELSKSLTMAGIEVEEEHNPAENVSGVIVARVESTEKHPDADRLQVCKVDNGTEIRTVVCGAPNVVAGMLVPYAQIGAKLPGFEISKRKMRGVVSEGMLCGRSELGLEDLVDGLWELPASLTLGEDIFTATGIGPSLVLGITPNRPDCLSHLGIARELAASSGARLKPTKWRLLEKGGDVSAQARVLVKEPTACPRYALRAVRNIKVGPSPEWLVRRLEQAGQRSINNVVDATNYVMLEYGQPLHAFDMARIDHEVGLPTVVVRYAEDGEIIETLNNEKHELTSADLVIADGSKAMALAGVMGGTAAEVTDGTTSVLLESAHFEPTGIRRTSKRCRLHTDSSHRFERGADPGIVERAIDRCAQLLTEVAGAEVSKGAIIVLKKGERVGDVNLRLRQIERILGVDMSAEKVVTLLEPLEIRCIAKNEDALRFETPSFRPDLTRERDLIEEIARRYGYDNIPERLPSTGGPVLTEVTQSRPSDVAKRTLRGLGITEAIHYAFGSPSAYKDDALASGEAVRIINPLGEEFSAMRTSLMPGLLDSLSRNQRQQATTVKLFEVGTVFFQKPEINPKDDEKDQLIPYQEDRAAWALWGGRHDGRWYEGSESFDFTDLAGSVESFLAAFGLAGAVVREPATIDGLNPFATANLTIHGETVGLMGQLHPGKCRELGISGPVYVAEIVIDHLVKQKVAGTTFKSLPKYPGTRRDVAVVVERSVSAESIRQFLIKNAGGALGPSIIQDVMIFDVYTDKSFKKNEVSLAFGIKYRSHDRTLTDGEVGTAFEAVLEGLKSKFDLEIR